MDRPNSRDSRPAGPLGWRGTAGAVHVEAATSALPVPVGAGNNEGGSKMIAARSRSVVRPLVLAATTAAFVLAMSVVVAQAPAHAATTAVTKKHARNEAAETKNEKSEHLQKMTERLKLTADQTARVKSIMDAQWAQSRELRAKNKGQPSTPENKAAMENARKDLHADTDAKLAQVLTADQMTEYKKMHTEHMKHMESEKDEAKESK